MTWTGYGHVFNGLVIEVRGYKYVYLYHIVLLYFDTFCSWVIVVVQFPGWQERLELCLILNIDCNIIMYN